MATARALPITPIQSRFYFPLELKTFVFAVYLMFPNVSSGDQRVDWLPVPPELIWMMTVALLLGYVYLQAVSLDMRGWPPLALAVGFFVLLTIPLLWTHWDEYTESKALRLFTQALPGLCFPFFLIRTKKDLHTFLNALAVVGLIYAALAIFTLATTSIKGQLTAGGSNPIRLGRFASIPALWLLFKTIHGQLPMVAGIGTSLMCYLLVVASGSRGALVSSLIASAVLFAISQRIGSRSRARSHALLIGTTCIALFAVIYLQEWFPVGSISRIQSFLAGDFGNSEMTRFNSARLSFDYILRNPVGLGWGAFKQEISYIPQVDVLDYAHNFIVELFLEAGWLAAIYFIGLLYLSFYGYWGSRSTTEKSGAWILMTCFFFNSLSSGDVPGNYLFLSLVSTGLVPLSEA